MTSNFFLPAVLALAVTAAISCTRPALTQQPTGTASPSTATEWHQTVFLWNGRQTDWIDRIDPEESLRLISFVNGDFVAFWGRDAVLSGQPSTYQMMCLPGDRVEQLEQHGFLLNKIAAKAYRRWIRQEIVRLDREVKSYSREWHINQHAERPVILSRQRTPAGAFEGRTNNRPI